MHGYIPPGRFFPYLSWPEVDGLADKANTLIIQPIGAVEQHGPHLPLVVDAAIASAVVGQALSQLEASVPAYALPTLCYGKSNEHLGFPGTITLTATTLMSVLMELAESLYRSGFRKIVFVNGHGGQPQILDIVARDLRARWGDLMVFPLFVWGAPHEAAKIVGTAEYDAGLHAGDVETSVMLALMPDQVDMSKAEKTIPQPFSPNSLLSLEGQLPTAWVMSDLSQTGIVGDATQATAEKGRQILTSVVAGWVQVLKDIYLLQPFSA